MSQITLTPGRRVEPPPTFTKPTTKWEGLPCRDRNVRATLRNSVPRRRVAVFGTIGGQHFVDAVGNVRPAFVHLENHLRLDAALGQALLEAVTESGEIRAQAEADDTPAQRGGSDG